jgi:deoxyuridine 5'-triphosphate nucleotidohydrolase
MESKQLFIAKTRTVKSPTRGTSLAAGIDLFIPEFTKSFITALISKNINVNTIRPGCYNYYVCNDEKKILLGPGERLLIPSGLKVKGHSNIALIAQNKSGVSSKKGLDILACVIDEDYQGEIHINIVNTSNNIVEICEGEKIIQCLETHIEYSELCIVSEEELFDTTTERGEGGFGSTNKN